jgi:hypothetical protein
MIDRSIRRWIPRLTSYPLLFAAVALSAAPWSSGDALATSVIVLSGGPSIEECSIVDSSPRMHTIFVSHAFNAGSTASRFRVVNGPGSTLSYISESTPYFSAIGNTQAGISFCYENCLAGTFILATIQYMGYGTSSPCGQQQIIAHPSAETVEIMNCASAVERAYVHDLRVEGPGGICGCLDPHFITGTAQAFDCTPLPVSATTWGAIKSLYAD